jgi:hypothetical protein
METAFIDGPSGLRVVAPIPGGGGSLTSSLVQAFLNIVDALNYLASSTLGRFNARKMASSTTIAPIVTPTVATASVRAGNVRA